MVAGDGDDGLENPKYTCGIPTYVVNNQFSPHLLCLARLAVVHVLHTISTGSTATFILG